MRAISTFSLEEGTSTLGSLALTPFRIRASRSATGSVMFMSFTSRPSPTRLDDSGNVPGQGELAEADAAQLELAEIPARTSAGAAAVVGAHLELGLPLGLGDERQL